MTLEVGAVALFIFGGLTTAGILARSRVTRSIVVVSVLLFGVLVYQVVGTAAARREVDKMDVRVAGGACGVTWATALRVAGEELAAKEAVILMVISPLSVLAIIPVRLPSRLDGKKGGAILGG
jgi:hypothetical protein